MKYVVLSFDDARKDFYTRALPILKKHGLCASVNVISDYVGETHLRNLASGDHSCASWEQLEECRRYGIEIANHSSNHTNTIEGVLSCKKALEEHFGPGIRGFVSPGSYITKKNAAPFSALKEEGQISYIRSGYQLRRDGYFHALLALCSEKFASVWFFRMLNKRYVLPIRQGCADIYPSIMLTANNTIEQVVHFIRNMKDNEAAILMFHSILEKDDVSWGRDRWFNSTDFFESLCSFLAQAPDTKVITNAALHELLKRQDTQH